MDENQVSTIETSDLYFAAYLQAKGCKITNTRRDGNKNIFTFVDEQNRPMLKEDYFNEDDGSLVVGLRYANCIRSLKTLCYVKN